MQLDRVRRDPGLPVLEVEEGDTGDDRAPADADSSSDRDHLLSAERCCAAGALERRRLSDYVS
jgi:hypothetical protein